MKYVESMEINIPSLREINQRFHFGDLTIFIGRSNSGKSRLLNAIYAKMEELRNSSQNKIEIYLKRSAQLGVELITNNKMAKSVLVNSPRTPVEEMGGLSSTLSKSAESLKSVDQNIHDLGSKEVQYSTMSTRPLKEQGSGIHNQLQVLQQLQTNNEIVLIDEPENSLFPYGKIELLSRIVKEMKKKQIILATHDPTLINQYLIKKMIDGKDITVVIYSFCEESGFEKLNFDNNLDPEIHAGYLSQTYSGKPVHLIVEGQTEFYFFQSLLTKYCIANKVPYFPKLLNKISISYVEGSQWHVNIHHLPDPIYYNVLMVLDGEHKNKLKTWFEKNIENTDRKYKFIKKIENSDPNKVNVITLEHENIEKLSKKVFGKKYKKTTELSEAIWSLTKKDFNQCLNKREGLFLGKVIEWCLNSAGWKVKKPIKRLSQDQKFKNKVRDYTRFKKKYPDREPDRNSENILERGLSRWMTRVRRLKRNGELSDERIKILDEINFDWNPEKKMGRRKGSKDKSIRSREPYIERHRRERDKKELPKKS